MKIDDKRIFRDRQSIQDEAIFRDDLSKDTSNIDRYSDEVRQEKCKLSNIISAILEIVSIVIDFFVRK